MDTQLSELKNLSSDDPYAQFEIHVRLTSPDGEPYDLRMVDFGSPGLAALLHDQLTSHTWFRDAYKNHWDERLQKEHDVFAALLYLVKTYMHDDGFGIGRELASNPLLRDALEPLRHTEEV